MPRSVKDLKNYHTRMEIAISELERLEDTTDYSEIVSTYADIVNKLEHRREVLQRRKYGR